jgi:predicted dinucleotide-binding enzyme
MNIGILGTGIVGRTIAARLAGLGHDVTLGTRQVARTLANTQSDRMGNPPMSEWLRQNPKVKLGTFAEAAAAGELLVNATLGSVSLDVLKLAGEGNLNGKVLIDISNPLDFSRGMPPTLTVCNTDSVGEQIQRLYPQVKVVKTLNTVNAYVMVDPRKLADGDHHIFVSGNDVQAKAQVTEILTSWFGWRHVLDLGDITTACGVEMYLPLWLRLFGALQTPMYNIKVVS